MDESKIAFDLSDSHRWLFLFAHPDDEVAIAAWVRRLVLANVDMQCAWVTHTPIRRAEAENFAVMVGIPPEKCHFLSGVDTQLIHHLTEVQVEIASLIDQIQPTRICTMAFEQGHLDHDTVNFLARQCFAGTIVEFPMYYGYWRGFMPLNTFTKPTNVEKITLDQVESEFKRTVSRNYPSQTFRRNVFWYGVLKALQLKPVFLHKRELLRLALHTDYLQPNHPEPIKSKILACPNWKVWKEAIESYRKST
jgi:LmbE family N-acetylglucosaminyl deacetylase